MQNLKWLPFICLTLSSLFAAGEGEMELQIKKFRFNRHSKLGFERLVIEFDSKSQGKEAPVIRLVPDKLGKETTVHVGKASLVGAIPEASINESYSKKSQYFGPVSINTDTNSGFDIKTFIKQSHSLVDAFWLQNPSRLIVDVFPKDSDRALGPNVVTQRSTASVSEKSPEGKMAKKETKTAEKQNPEWTKMEKPEDELVLCFPANTQVKANIGFEKGNNRAGFVPQSIDNTFSTAAGSVQDNIVCYPKGAQVTPLLKFQPSENSFYGRVDMDNAGRGGVNPMNPRQPSSVPQFNPGYFYPQAPQMGYPGSSYYTPPSMPKFAPQQQSFMGREQGLNNEADVALALPDDATLNQRAQGGSMGYQESFSQKTPPQSLGKKLPPPGKGN
jgi:hypothetical protein